MNSEILKRVVRAIADASQGDLEQLAHTIVKSERQIGHTRLADELETILARSRPIRTRYSHSSEQTRPLSDLPTSRRRGESLLALLPRESLEHHMVLPREVDARFARIEQEYAPVSALVLTAFVHGRLSCSLDLPAAVNLLERKDWRGTYSCFAHGCRRLW